MSVYNIMGVVERRQYRPNSVDLRVVLVDFGHQQEDGDQEQRECEGCYQRVRVEVDLSERSRICDRLEVDLGKCAELIHVWPDRLVEI